MKAVWHLSTAKSSIPNRLAAKAVVNVFRPPNIEGLSERERGVSETVFVTSSSRGFKAIALGLARDGYDVGSITGAAAGAAAVAQEIIDTGRVARILQFDIGARDATAAAGSSDIAVHGCYYGVVCNAGVVRITFFLPCRSLGLGRSDENESRCFYNVLHPLIMPMVRRRKPGRIVTVASVSGLIGNRGQVNYSAAKAGIIGATKALALELAKREITANCVAPGLIDTEMICDVPLEEAVKMIPLRRVGKTEKVAAVVSFLMSQDAAYITRQVISVNGGLA